MPNQIPEPDWRLLRTLKDVALDRFCQRFLLEISRLAADETQSAHDRYLEIYKLVQRRDKQLARTFNDLRRSNAILQLALMRAQGLVTDEEFRRFSAETRRIIESIAAG